MKSKKVHQNSKEVMLLKLLVGDSIKPLNPTIGLLKTLGEQIGVSMDMHMLLLDKKIYTLMSSQLLLLQRLSKKILMKLMVKLKNQRKRELKML